MANEKGFSLIEMLLSVGIISVLVGLSLPIYQSFQSRNDLDLTTQSIAEMVRRAQTYARGNKGDGNWGVRIMSGSAVLFKGPDYVSRDPNLDEMTVIPSALTPGGLKDTDILFSKLTGTPSPTGSITLTNTNINDTRTITLNAKGMVSY